MKRVFIALALVALGALPALRPASAQPGPSLVPSVIDWVPVTGPTGDRHIRFHVKWENRGTAPSGQISGAMHSQPFGVFLPNHGLIGTFNVPPLQPSSFFDVFFEVPLTSLPPSPDKITPNNGGGVPALAASSPGGPSLLVACPPDTNWAGNVDLIWSGPGGTGTVNKHYGDLLTCPGGAPSYVHMKFSNCTGPMPWSVVGLCPGFSVTLVNEDFTPASNPVPPGWTGWIQVNAAAVVPSGTSCCFGIVFQCQGVSSTIDICSTACDCQGPVGPVLGSVDWTTSGTVVTFHQHWENPSAASPSQPASGQMSSQALGVFLPNFGPIGHFDVPSIAPGGFFDIFIDEDLSALPPEPVTEGGPGGSAGTPCLPQQWHGNVDLIWAGAGGTGNANYHFDEVPVCPGAGPTYVHIETGCNDPVGATWTVAVPCPGFTATLVNLDHSPAPNPLPANWVGLIAVSAAAGTPFGTPCCFKINFKCGDVPATIDVCAKACDCGRKPRIKKIDWTKVGSAVRFHLQWENPDASGTSEPVSGEMNSQPFGAFAQNFGPIGHFDVPPIAPSSFFDVFLEVPLSDLPPEPQEELPGGGPPVGSPCPEDTSWSGNVDIMWSGSSEVGQTNYHFTSLLVRPGFGSSHVHTLIFCNSSAGAAWSIAGLCPGFNATLLNEDFTPAPNPVPANWTGWISVAASGSVPAGTSCCFSVTFVCDGVPGVINVCAETCDWAVNGVETGLASTDFGISSAAPNPTRTGMEISYVMPKAGRAKIELYTLAGQRVRTLVDGEAHAGTNSVRWNGRGENDRTLPPGAYFVTLKAGERVASRKVVLFH